MSSTVNKCLDGFFRSEPLLLTNVMVMVGSSYIAGSRSSSKSVTACFLDFEPDLVKWLDFDEDLADFPDGIGVTPSL